MVTIFTFLMHKAATAQSYSKLVDIVDFPDLGSEPELIDQTTLTDTNRIYEFGVQDTGSLAFNAKYSPSDFDTLKALEGTDQSYSVWFGGTKSGSTVTPTGSGGKFDFTGKLSVFVTGGGVNDPLRMQISIAPSSSIDKQTTSASTT